FKNFKNGIVLLTVKFDIENDGKETIGKSSISSKLYQNDGQEYSLTQGLLTSYRNSDVIKPAEDGELLQVFTIDAEPYAKLVKDNSYEVEIGPRRDEAAKDISKGDTVKFKLK